MHASISLDPETLLSAYAQGAFPMADRDGTIRWYTADPRGIIPLDKFHVPRTLRQVVRQKKFDVRINYDFAATMRACMNARKGQTWISEPLVAAYVRLHHIGFAHSVECYLNNRLTGGLYGVSLGAAFFGESMFHTQTNASKIALVHLIERLREREFELLDAQADTPHLAQFGCTEISAEQYLRKLHAAMQKRRRFD